LSLLARVALIGAALLVAAVLLVLLVWKPSSQAAFVSRTDGMLRDTEHDFEAVATSLVDEAMEFAGESALAADHQRALSIEDLPLDLFTDEQGRLKPERLREAVRAALTAPDASQAEKHAAVRGAILEHTRRDALTRLRRLRKAQTDAAARHAEQVAWRTVAAWAGVLLLLFAGWALILDRVVLRPLREVTAAVGRFGAGERGTRIRPSGARELATLADVFNETASAVERTEAENAELRAQLEEKVRERTTALVRAARASTAGTMAGGVAHEFNNLLGGILGCTEAALDENPSAEVREALEMVRKTATRGVGVTRALLRATRAEPEPGPCDPVVLFEDALEQVRLPDGIEVVREFEADAGFFGDAAMLGQVLGNLVRNAVEAMGEQGRLVLGAARVGDEIRLRIEDDGPGIEPSVRDILFEPFVTTRHGGREGVGLGLFLADRLVAAHGGRLDVDSEPGQGTRFLISLPSARDS